MESRAASEGGVPPTDSHAPGGSRLVNPSNTPSSPRHALAEVAHVAPQLDNRLARHALATPDQSGQRDGCARDCDHFGAHGCPCLLRPGTDNGTSPGLRERAGPGTNVRYHDSPKGRISTRKDQVEGSWRQVDQITSAIASGFAKNSSGRSG